MNENIEHVESVEEAAGVQASAEAAGVAGFGTETSDAVGADAKASRKRAAFVGAGVALAVALASGGTVGVAAWHHHNAASAYSAAVEADRGAAADLATTISEAEKTLVEARAAGVSEDDLRALSDLLVEAKKQTTLAGDLNDGATTRALREGTASLTTHTQSLQVVLDGLKAESVKVEEKTRQVRVEQAKKRLADAISGAEAALADAGQTLADSEGRVGDNQVRADLENGRAGFQSQLDEAKNLNTEDVSKVDEAAKNLDEATKVFATQIQAVKDAHGAWEAQQAQAAASAASSRRSSGGSYTAPARGSNGGNGGVSAPARGNGGGTTNSSSSSNSGGGWVETSETEHLCGWTTSDGHSGNC